MINYTKIFKKENIMDDKKEMDYENLSLEDKMDLLDEGIEVEFTALEAEQLGAFVESALTLEDAQDARGDKV